MKGIYAIQNKINKKMYIGMTTDFKDRIEYHLWELRNNKHHSIKLQRAFNKYGEDNFEYYVLEEMKESTSNQLAEKERDYIKKYDTYNNGYNCSLGGEKEKGYTPSQEAIRKLIIRNKTTKPMLGKHLSQKSKDKISKANKGKGNGFYGKTHSEENKKKFSEHAKKMWQEHYEEYKQRLTKINQSEKRRKEVSEQMRGNHNQKSKVTEKDVIEIRKRYDSGEKPRFILKDYPQLSKSGLMKICIRETWKYLEKEI